MMQTKVWLVRVASGVSLCIAIVIVVLSLMPSDRLGGMTDNIPYADKGAHALAYAVFGFCMFIAVSAKTVQYKGIIGTLVVPCACVVACTALLGYVIELVQPLFNRQYELLDLWFDIGGSIVGSLAAWAVLGYLSRRRRAESDSECVPKQGGHW